MKYLQSSSAFFGIKKNLIGNFSKDLNNVKTSFSEHYSLFIIFNIFPLQQSLGILEENENSTDGIISILKEEHTLVPCHLTTNLRTFAVGDLLTVERSQNAQKGLQDAITSTKRLDGLIPALADFHTYGNFLEVSIKHICSLYVYLYTCNIIKNQKYDTNHIPSKTK